MVAHRVCEVHKYVASGVFAALLLVAPFSFAAPQSGDGDDDDATDNKPAEPKEAEPVRPPPPTAVVAPAPERVQSDHTMMVRRFGVSWFGVSSIPIATGAPAGSGDEPIAAAGAPTSVSTPAIGVRYWLTERIGLDFGGGFSLSSGEVRTVTSGNDKATVFSLLAHAGMPVSITSGRHISLQLIPEMNLGFAMSSVEPTQGVDPPPNANLSGVRFDVGARVGGEVHFGFMDIPELSIEGSVGAFLTYQATKITVGEAYASQTNLLLTTASYQNPWDIFTSYVRARYYF